MFGLCVAAPQELDLLQGWLNSEDFVLTATVTGGDIQRPIGPFGDAPKPPVVVADHGYLTEVRAVFNEK